MMCTLNERVVMMCTLNERVVMMCALTERVGCSPSRRWCNGHLRHNLEFTSCAPYASGRTGRKVHFS